MDEPTLQAHAARLGDRHALEAFVRASYRDVWRLCAALVDEQTAEDLAQETFVRATRALGDFRGSSSARTWVLAIARHVCMDELRARSRRRRRDTRIAATPEEALMVPDTSGEVAAHELLSLLDPDRRVAFVLTQLFRFSYEQAACICDCPVGTIRSRVARAREELIAALEEPAERLIGDSGASERSSLESSG
jgi:RNA polymerase sigma-70 factor (ECF subfamily)